MNNFNRLRKRPSPLETALRFTAVAMLGAGVNLSLESCDTVEIPPTIPHATAQCPSYETLHNVTVEGVPQPLTTQLKEVDVVSGTQSSKLPGPPDLDSVEFQATDAADKKVDCYGEVNADIKLTDGQNLGDLQFKQGNFIPQNPAQTPQSGALLLELPSR